MSMEISAYPLTWPAGWKRTAPDLRKRARFSRMLDGSSSNFRGKQILTVADGVTRLVEELMRLGVGDRHDIITSTNIEVRLDGFPYSNRPEPLDPGVSVYWRMPAEKDTKCMAVDRYDRVAGNIAAVAATVSAMRAIERHGGAEILDRAFTGFIALPAPGDWRKILGLSNRQDINLEVAEKAYRSLAKDAHPDTGGTVIHWQQISTAIAQAREELAR